MPAACCALLLPFLVLSTTLTRAQRPAPAPAQSRSILVKAAVVHVGDGRVFNDGAVGFRNGLIDYVGFSYGTKASYDTVITVADGQIYPGFILPDATIGLQEIDLVRATADAEEMGSLEPEVRARTAYNADSRITPTVRANGVLLAQIAPRGGLIAGTSTIVQFDAWSGDDAAVKSDEGIQLYWPPAYRRENSWTQPGDVRPEPRDKRQVQLDAMRQFFREAQAYAKAPTPEEVDIRMEAMRGLFDGSKTLYVHADLMQEIQEAVTFAHDMEVKRLVLVGGYDAWRLADLLRDRHVSVILRRLHSLPLRDDDDIDQPFRLPALLKERGVPFCLGYSGDMERMGARNLGFTAGTASAFGLSREEALTAITLDAARILRIDDHYGSLEVGKSATLFVSTGDALDMRTCNVVNAWIQGRTIVLDDHQKQLYRAYEQRYRK